MNPLFTDPAALRQLKALAGMWEEVAGMYDRAGRGHLAHERRDCARDLRQIIAGDLSSIELIEERETRTGRPHPIKNRIPKEIR